MFVGHAQSDHNFRLWHISTPQFSGIPADISPDADAALTAKGITQAENWAYLSDSCCQDKCGKDRYGFSPDARTRFQA